MNKKTKIFLVPLMLICVSVLSSGVHAQPVGLADKDAELQAVIANAIKTAKVENGKIRSFELSLPHEKSRFIAFEHATDGRSFTIHDEGRKTVVVVDELRRISEVTFPNGKKASFEWAVAPAGLWVPSAIRVDGKSLCQSSSIVEADCRDVCERAAALAAIATATCAALPLSTPCWSATASAAVASYFCYRCLFPEAEAPPES